MLIPIETERLYMRPLELCDAERLFLMDSDVEVIKYIGVPPLKEFSQSIETIEFFHKQYETNGIGRFAVIEKESGLLIGWSGLKRITDEVNGHSDFYELGYRFIPEKWGKGYATESTIPFIERAFLDMGVENLYAYAHHENTASHHVLGKLGFTEKESFEEPDSTYIWFDYPAVDFFEKKGKVFQEK